MKKLIIEDVFKDSGLSMGRLLSYSKSAYCREHPKNIVIFNSNVFSEKENRKVWFGDIDLTEDRKALSEIAKQIGKICVLSEMNGRFGNEKLSYKQAEEKSLAIFGTKQTKE